MRDGVGFEFSEQFENPFAITNVEFVMVKTFEVAFETFLVPPSVTLRAEEGGALVVVDAVNLPAKLGEVNTDFGADEAGGSSNEELQGKC